MRKAIKAVIIISIVLVSIFVIYPIIAVSYAMHIFDVTYKTEYNKAMAKYDNKQNKHLLSP